METCLCYNYCQCNFFDTDFFLSFMLYHFHFTPVQQLLLLECKIKGCSYNYVHFAVYLYICLYLLVFLPVYICSFINCFFVGNIVYSNCRLYFFFQPRLNTWKKNQKVKKDHIFFCVVGENSLSPNFSYNVRPRSPCWLTLKTVG